MDKHGITVFIFIPGGENNSFRIPNTNITVKEFFISQNTPSSFDKAKHFFLKRFSNYSYVYYLELRSRAIQIHDFLRVENDNFQFDLIQYSNLNGIGYFPLQDVCSVVRISSLTHLYLKYGEGYYGIDPFKVQAQIRFENKSYKKFKFIVGPSSYMLNHMKFIKDVFKTRILSPYENRTSFSVSEYTYTPNIKIGYFGSVDYRKGIDLLLDAISSLSEEKLSLTVVGKLYEDSPENRTIKQRILNQSNIIYFQSQSKFNLIRILQDVDIIVLPSRVDNLPNTLLESLGMGKIVVGPNAWGFEEVIEDGVNGFLFEVGSQSSLTETLKVILSLSNEERGTVCMKAKEFISNYSSDYVFSNCMEVYNQCIKISNNICVE
ncbi:glycosyltransferase family 4 protein [Algoriphagus ratkowskyi]|uniref:glycosyltransferase family 4 protein n=1 Tax=Algoriphagus ratkowskyi TaxID=57028 RepID=UPI0011783FC1|nr:glycosyltransferase [Algoriphagus ratkowskyi]